MGILWAHMGAIVCIVLTTQPKAHFVIVITTTHNNILTLEPTLLHIKISSHKIVATCQWPQV